jgi:hypothetical protein
MEQERFFRQQSQPCVVISLDFELRWGVHHRLGCNIDTYRANIENVRIIVPALLKMFTERGVHATWAYVGAVGCSGWNEFFERAPSSPKYTNTDLAFNPRFADIDPSGSLYFAPELVEMIGRSKGQELGTHTFSHVFAREPGFTANDLISDLNAVAKIGIEKFGGAPISLVFPRNQTAWLETMYQRGIKIYRSNQDGWCYDATQSGENTMLARSCRLVRDLNPLESSLTDIQSALTQASLFVRFDLPYLGWILHFERIRREIQRITCGQVFHLWWHPHNLGGDLSRSLERAQRIADLVSEGVAHARLKSRNMREVYEEYAAPKGTELRFSV